ncbi:MAG: META domain-containing protein [Hyphomonadaceae bacterium]
MKRLMLIVASTLALSACGQSEETLDGRWRVQQITGASLGEDVEIWISFDAANETVAGFTGCNNFSAPLSAFSDSISIGPLSEAAGECDSLAAATDEQRFLMVLPQVQRRIVRGRSLELLQAASGSETLIRLRREDDRE